MRCEPDWCADPQTLEINLGEDLGGYYPVVAVPRRNDGRDLETAVEDIERLILQAGGPTPSRITIEPRKVVITDGVKDEVDLYVRVDSAPGYSAVFLFECKDWTKPVGKNHVDGLKAKMRRLEAQSAFFVAPRFTRDARALAAQTPKVLLHDAKAGCAVQWAAMNFSFFKPLQWTYDLHLTAVAAESSIRTTPPEKVQDLPSSLWGMDLPLRRAAREVLSRECTEQLRARFGSAPPPGEHRFEFWQARFFEPLEFRIGEAVVRGLTVKGSARRTVIAPTKVVAFEVAGRGRTIEYTWNTLEGETVQGRLTQTDQVEAGP